MIYESAIAPSVEYAIDVAILSPSRSYALSFS